MIAGQMSKQKSTQHNRTFSYDSAGKGHNTLSNTFDMTKQSQEDYLNQDHHGNLWQLGNFGRQKNSSIKSYKQNSAGNHATFGRH